MRGACWHACTAKAMVRLVYGLLRAAGRVIKEMYVCRCCILTCGAILSACCHVIC